MAAADLGRAEWERSKISTQDLNLLKKLGISKKPKALCFPSEESYPTPPMGYRKHPNLVSLPPLPEGGEVEERAVVTDDNQDAPSFANEPTDSRKSAGSIEKEAASEEKLAAVNDRANTLTQKLERSEEARKKAESDAVQARAEADKAKTDAAGVEVKDNVA
ncbi:hypothetical protein QYE76_026704 [Lolium multiflorum]|uniref:Uncharacterized protein n=1 Tax=Lolium multiflorum TaxID=4521 RepID=A0AAD8RHS8_LOLMU|nr:hypothetical protein QYE76_026704 [Lolium multiflorum]